MNSQARHLSAFPITPCDASGRVDVAALRRLLARLLVAQVGSIGLLGSTGSYPYLDRAERRRAVETAVEQANGAMPILVGIGALRTDTVVALAQDAKAIGATAGLLAPISYTPLSDDEVFTHFATVARDGGLPLHIYDNPGTTHFTIAPSLLARLSRVPGIVAVKSPAPPAEAVMDHVASLRAAVPADFAIGCSGDWHAAEALIAGTDTWYSVAAGLFPAACGAVTTAAGHDAAEARRRNAALEPLWDLFRRFSSLRTVFAAADILGVCAAEPPRPILPLGPDARREVEAVLGRLGLA